MNQLEIGLAMKDAGVYRTTAANGEWMMRALGVIDLARRHLDLPAVNADVLRRLIVEWIGEPDSPNAWGALFTHLQKSRKLVWTGVHTRSTRKEARGRQIPVWRWA